jgi:hypothetical protein
MIHRNARIMVAATGLALLWLGALPGSPAQAATRAPVAPAGTGLIRAQGISPHVSKVTVPSNYVYKPALGTLHDYCTNAPDEFPAPGAANADFRGPCARHDLCYGSSTVNSVCDRHLRANMYANCQHYYSWYNPLRVLCEATADVYWVAVVAAT